MGIAFVNTRRYSYAMETLRTYLNSMSVADQAEYAVNCDTTIGYLRKALSTSARIDGALCRKLDENSGGAVPRGSLRPDIWPPEKKQKRRAA